MSAFVTLSIILAAFMLIVGFLMIQHVYHAARRRVGDGVARDLKRIRDEDAKLTESLSSSVAQGGSLADTIGDYKARRRQLLPAAAVTLLPDPALWDEHELSAHHEANIRDALVTAKRSYNLRVALLMTIVVLGMGLTNAVAYFAWFSRATAAVVGDEYDSLPSPITPEPDPGPSDLLPRQPPPPSQAAEAAPGAPQAPASEAPKPPAPDGLDHPRPVEKGRGPSA